VLYFRACILKYIIYIYISSGMGFGRRANNPTL